MGFPMQPPSDTPLPRATVTNGTKGYPSTSQMPEMQEPADEGSGDPVVQALTTLTAVTKAMEQQGDPRGAKLKEHLLGFMQVISGGAQEGQPEEQAPEAPAQFNPFEPPKEPTKPAPGMQGQNASSMGGEAQPLV